MNWLRKIAGFIAPREIPKREAQDSAGRTHVAPSAPALGSGQPAIPAAARAPELMPRSSLDFLVYGSWQDVDARDWWWPSFTARELACKGTGELIINRRALDALQALRVATGKPLVIASAYRSPEHNAAVDGAKNSRHMQGDAFDVVMTGHDVPAFAAAAKRHGFTGFGYYPKATPPFMHIDMGPPRTWGAPIPREA